MERKRRLTRAFRTINFYDTSLGQTADAQCNIERKRTGRHRFNLYNLIILTKAHNRAFAERPFDLRQSRIESLCLVH